MLQIHPTSKVYAYAPAGVVTGGVELLHQLVDVINRHRGDAYIVYYGDAPHEVPSAYAGYRIQLADEVEDRAENVVVCYEGYFKIIPTIRHAQVLVWWLSVDNYYLCNRLSLRELLYFQRTNTFKFPPKLFLRNCLSALLGVGRNDGGRWSVSRLHRERIALHAYQSEYAKDFLQRNGFTAIYPLKDYINADNFEGDFPSEHKDIVLYNPKKGWAFTQQLIAAAPEIRWTPIQNMTRKEVIATMRRAKVYIDFGYHPGKDRLPREAAINGCTIVTGRQGSAGFSDVSIPEQYKHLQRATDIPAIIAQVKDLLAHYEERTADFEPYRASIRAERAEFEAAILHLFQLSV